jgi:hypothetical protein
MPKTANPSENLSALLSKIIQNPLAKPQSLVQEYINDFTGLKITYPISKCELDKQKPCNL